ncbi:La-related protein 6 [Hordeum vulgare]|nr:La-related protein 6 [Hordeum vulgare]
MAHPNPLGLIAEDLIHGPAVGLLRLVVKNFPFYISIEPLLSFLKDTFCDAGLGSTTANLDLIDGDHKEGTLSGSSKGKDPIYDITEGTLHPCSSKGKEAICAHMECTQRQFFCHGNEPICDK